MAKTIYAARIEAKKFSRRYGQWHVVRSPAGEYYTMAYAPDRLDSAPELVATYINGKRFEEGAK